MRPYNVIAPPYRHTSGGIMACWKLGEELAARGMQVTMNEHTTPEAITVYPEIVPTNVLNSEAPVWWMLNVADRPAPRWAWAEDCSPGDPLLTVNVIDLDLFRPRTGKREGILWWAHKGGYLPEVIPEGARQITMDWPATKAELAEVLGSAQAVISFDGRTMLSAEAALVGTPVVVLAPIQGLDAGVRYGIANTYEEACATVHLAYDDYVARLPEFARRVDAFVEDTQALYPA